LTNRLFLSCITDRKEFPDSIYEVLTRIQGDQDDARSGHHALPTAEVMDRIRIEALRHE